MAMQMVGIGNGLAIVLAVSLVGSWVSTTHAEFIEDFESYDLGLLKAQGFYIFEGGH